MVYGVYSHCAANTKLKNGYDFYDWIVRKNCFPEFWGRTISGDSKISKEEINYLNQKGCKIFFIDNSLTEESISGISGVQDALKAIDKIKSLEISTNKRVAVFAEINSNWSINHNWMISYAGVLFDNGFTPGFIGNTDSSKNFNFDRQASHFFQATGKFNHFNALIMATEPKPEKEPEEWKPYCPSEISQKDITLWEISETNFDDFTAHNVYLQDKKTFDVFN